MSRVYLLGAGPGDPELLTLKGKRVLGLADSVLYDHLANPALLGFSRPDAERVYVGKKRSNHAFTQDEIVGMMIERARRGLTVVRLKGGDPFIFGRGGEEIEGLAAEGIAYEVVPGVTAPLGIAACTGVPLTHREHSSTVTFVTGHEVDSIDWSRTGVTGTVVIFMGLQHLRGIAARMIAAGRDGQTPAMAVRWGTRPTQQTVAGTLADLADRTEAAHLLPPATIFVGEVVALRDQLTWFEKRPLFGQKIVVTRAREQAGDLSARLSDAGAEVIELPVIELAPVADYSALDTAIGELERFDWVVLTSVNAVEYLLARIRSQGRDVRAIRGRICAIGPATARALDAVQILADLIPEESSSEGIAAAFAGIDLQGAQVLLPRAASARDVIPEALITMGARVYVADAYRNVIPAEAPEAVAELLSSKRRPDWILFTSGSTVKNWLTLAGADSLRDVRIASIGPATSDVIRKHGLTVAVEASPHTADALADAVSSYGGQGAGAADPGSDG